MNICLQIESSMLEMGVKNKKIDINSINRKIFN